MKLRSACSWVVFPSSSNSFGFPRSPLKVVDLHSTKLAAVIKANDNISCSSLDFGAIFLKEGNFEQCYALHPYYYYGLKNDRQTRYGLLLHFDPTLVKGILGILIHICYKYLYSPLPLALFGAYTLNLWTG